MTASKTVRAALDRIRRTLSRTLRCIAFKSATLTLSVPPFVKLEIKTTATGPTRRRKHHRKAA